MDIQRPDMLRSRRRKRTIFAVVGVLCVAATTIALSRLRPAAPSVDKSPLWLDEVKRGSMLFEVTGLGTLVPEVVRIIPAVTEGRVEEQLLLPGSSVNPNSVILVLSNPQLEQQAMNAQYQLSSAQAQYHNLEAQLQNQLMTFRAAAASAHSQFTKADMNAKQEERLWKNGLEIELKYQTAALEAKALATQDDVAQKQVEIFEKSIQTQLSVQQATIDQDRATAQLYRREVDELRVRPGIAGILQAVAVQPGEDVTPGTELATVAQPSHLKAQLQVAETQARDVQLGQRVSIDTHNGIVPGHVIRIDPSVLNGTRTVDVQLDGPLPPGAVPNLSVDGIIRIEELRNVLYVGRPFNAKPDSMIEIFRLLGNGTEAARVRVKLGKTSANQVQILSGLGAGDKVILSDMSQWDSYNRIELRQ